MLKMFKIKFVVVSYQIEDIEYDIMSKKRIFMGINLCIFELNMIWDIMETNKRFFLLVQYSC